MNANEKELSEATNEQLKAVMNIALMSQATISTEEEKEDARKFGAEAKEILDSRGVEYRKNSINLYELV